jgi:hypothetical protein
MSPRSSPCISMYSEGEATGRAPGNMATRHVPPCIVMTLRSLRPTDLNTVGLCPCGFESRLRHVRALQANLTCIGVAEEPAPAPRSAPW